MDGSRSTQKGIAFVHRKRVSPEEKSSNFNLQHEGAEIGAADLGFGLRVDVSLRRQLCLRLEAIASRERERESAPLDDLLLKACSGRAFSLGSQSRGLRVEGSFGCAGVSR